MGPNNCEMNMSIKWNEDQLAGLAKIEKWLTKNKELVTSIPDKQLRLVGAAGTGKTSLLIELISKRDVSHWAFCSPTNKATKVMRNMLSEYTDNCLTIYSLLGLRMTQDEDRMILTRPRKVDLSNIDVIVLDEASMVNTELYKYLREAMYDYGVLVLYVADQFQLNPVGEERSPIFNVECEEVVLSKVERHDNQILTLATSIRECIANGRYDWKLPQSDNDKFTGIWTFPEVRKFYERIEKYAKDGKFSGSAPEAVAAAWRNRTVNELNHEVRRHLFTKEERRTGMYLVNDRIVLTAQVKEKQGTGYDDYVILATIDDTGIIRQVYTEQHPVHIEVMIYNIMVELDDGNCINLRVAHESSNQYIMKRLQDLAADAKSKPPLWKAFWEFKESFHQIKHGYASTVHRLQGSTIKTTFVDTNDILQNYNVEESYRCLYVGCSRSTHKTFLH